MMSESVQDSGGGVLLSEAPPASQSTRFLFDSYLAAVEALITVLEDARSTEAEYEFGGLSAQAIRTSGLTLVGDIEDIARRLENIAGAARYDD